MKKLTRTLTRLLTVAILCVSILPLYVCAEDGISTYLLNTDQCICSFSAASGTASIGVSYEAKEANFSYAKLTVKIQKRFLGVFWSTVDLGLTADEWIAYNYSASGFFSNSFPLEKTGTYRAVFTVEIYGKDGSVDTIEDTITSTYD